MHSAFIGTRIWPESTPRMATGRADFDAAIDVLCRFAAVSQNAGRSSNPTRHMEQYFAGLRFAEMCDLINSARLVRLTAPSHRSPRQADLLVMCAPGAGGDPLVEACLAVEMDTMDEHLEYIWRHPDEFPREDDFHRELYVRALRTSFADMDEAPCSVEELRSELDNTGLVFEDSKRDRDMAFNTWVLYAWRPPDGVSRADEKAVKKALKRGEWPDQVARAFEWKAGEMRRLLRHVVLWGQRTNTPGITMPVLSGSAPSR